MENPTLILLTSHLLTLWRSIESAPPSQKTELRETYRRVYEIYKKQKVLAA